MEDFEGPDDAVGAAMESISVSSRLARWLAHEINNPLAGIQSSFALVQRLIPATHPQHRFVEAIEREIARLAAVTLRYQQAYDFDDKPAGPMPVAQCLGDALIALEPLRAIRRVRVEVELDAAAGRQPVAGVVALAAIRHLIQHAIESARPDQTIRVAGWCEPDRLWISVPVGEPEARHLRHDAAGPPGLALRLATRLVRTLNGEITVTHPEAGAAGEVRVGLPFPRPAMEAP